MSKLAELKTILKPFVDLSYLKVKVDTNEFGQITHFSIEYNGASASFEVVDMEIEGAWHRLENFVAKNHKR